MKLFSPRPLAGFACYTEFDKFWITIDLGIWNRQTRLGKAFDASTGFRLPKGCTRLSAKCAALTDEDCQELVLAIFKDGLTAEMDRYVMAHRQQVRTYASTPHIGRAHIDLAHKINRAIRRCYR